MLECLNFFAKGGQQTIKCQDEVLYFMLHTDARLSRELPRGSFSRDRKERRHR